MARISKRKAAARKIQAVNKRVYKAGIYVRLSSEKDIKQGGQVIENNSIEVQRQICMEFVENFNKSCNNCTGYNNCNNYNEIIDITEFYSDIGKTGTNFRREGFQNLMQDIRIGKIDCVIVKDLSRFGRDYLETGNYIEKIFPFLGVRFIAVTDKYDTNIESNSINNISLEIKNLMNDMYAKDFSFKSKLSLKQRREQGSYVGGQPPYGYNAIWKGKIRKLVPDRNTAGIVQYIFNKFIEKKQYKAVTNALEQQRINPPTVYKETRQVVCPCGMEYKKWDKNAVIRILKNRTYTGVLEQGKTSINMRDESTRVKKDKSEWIIKENTHKAIISQELFEKAAWIISRKSRQGLSKL